MPNHTYDYPLTETVDLGTAQAAVSVAGKSALYQSLSILDASCLVGSTPAAVTISIGDGTDADRFGTITVAAGGTANNSGVVTLNLTDAAYELNNVSDVERLVFTNTTAPANAVAGLKVVIGRY